MISPDDRLLICREAIQVMDIMKLAGESLKQATENTDSLTVAGLLGFAEASFMQAARKVELIRKIVDKDRLNQNPPDPKTGGA